MLGKRNRSDSCFVPRLYKQTRPGSNYEFSLNLLKKFKAQHPGIPTKSGLMVGLGETDEEILAVMRDMRAHHIEMLTIGQYLAPTSAHLPVQRYVTPDTFKCFISLFQFFYKFMCIGFFCSTQIGRASCRERV